MSVHDYTPELALETLLRKVRGKDGTLAERIRSAIDAGKDINETETPKNRWQRPRVYRRKVAYSHEEALVITLDVLQAHFIELPLFINSAAADFEKAAIGTPAQTSQRPTALWHEGEAVTIESEGEPKQLQVELQTETQLSAADQATLSLEPVPPEQLREERANFL